MTDRDRIEQITTILCQIKTNGSAKAPNVYDNKSTIGVLYYAQFDVKELKTLRKNLIALQKFNQKQEVKIVTGSHKDNRLEKDKPKKATLKYIDLNSILK